MGKVAYGEGRLGKVRESDWKGVDDDRIGSFHSAKSRFLEILACFWYCFGRVFVTIVGVCTPLEGWRRGVSVVGRVWVVHTMYIPHTNTTNLAIFASFSLSLFIFGTLCFSRSLNFLYGESDRDGGNRVERVDNEKGGVRKMGESGWKSVDNDRIGSFPLGQVQIC